MGGTVGIMLAILRPDLVSQLIVAEANVSPGGGEATRRIASCSESEYVNEAHQALLEELTAAEKEGNVIAASMNSAWSKADPSGLYKSSVALVELDATLKDRFQKLSIPRTFIYGERSLPEDRNQVRPDAPDPDELREHDIQIAFVPDAGHAMMLDNPHGFVHVLRQAIQSPDADGR
jgi:pimeloyl-ACP methyl ester carboxylesterase